MSEVFGGLCAYYVTKSWYVFTETKKHQICKSSSPVAKSQWTFCSSCYMFGTYIVCNGSVWGEICHKVFVFRRKNPIV